MKKLTTEKLIEYMKNRTDEPLRQDAEKLANACNEAAYEFNHNDALDMLKLVCFQEPIPSLHTHSYSFNTATGRHIINTIKEYYYE
jgi:hypothetical protein